MASCVGWVGWVGVRACVLSACVVRNVLCSNFYELRIWIFQNQRICLRLIFIFTLPAFSSPLCAAQSATRTRTLHSASKGAATIAQAAAAARPATAAVASTTTAAAVLLLPFIVDTAAAAQEHHQTRQSRAHAAASHVVRGTQIAAFCGYFMLMKSSV